MEDNKPNIQYYTIVNNCLLQNTWHICRLKKSYAELLRNKSVSFWNNMRKEIPKNKQYLNITYWI